MTATERALHLKQIKEKNGRLTASNVVAAATPKSHPLHDCFEWDNKKAGHQFRLTQARGLIRSVKVTYDDRPVRQYHHVKVVESYEEIETIMTVPKMKDDLMSNLKRDFLTFKNKYNCIAGLSEWFSKFPIDELERETVET